MKLEPIVKIDKRNKVTSEIFNDDVMSESLDTIAIFPFFYQFGATGSRIPDA